MRRVTRPRTLIVEELKHSDAFSTARMIYSGLQARGKKVGIATVYRNLQIMAGGKEVDTLQVHGETFYRLCRDHHHHHHLICRECGKAVELEIPGFEEWTRLRAESLGFSDVSHSLELFGLCAACRLRESKGDDGQHRRLSSD
ncbi:Fur family transcriptional regulator [Bifidobacterium psychraerophilum]|uniref:Fur family transcriptional regulator n=1 Tax=Bifidobacterium psychraerophilum TaxID=218140 RepID=UPI0033425C47